MLTTNIPTVKLKLMDLNKCIWGGGDVRVHTHTRRALTGEAALSLLLCVRKWVQLRADLQRWRRHFDRCSEITEIIHSSSQRCTTWRQKATRVQVRKQVWISWQLDVGGRNDEVYLKLDTPLTSTPPIFILPPPLLSFSSFNLREAPGSPEVLTEEMTSSSNPFLLI